MASTVGDGWTISLSLLVVGLCLGHARFTFNLQRCRKCTYKADVPCIVQHMVHPCMAGIRADPLAHGRKWPGPIRDLKAKVERENGTQFANFTWKAPYDSSVETLKGFEIHLAVQDDSTMASHCFYANITDNSWTKSANRYNVGFHFDCIESQTPLYVKAIINSVPRPHVNVSRKEVVLVLRNMVMWNPVLHYTVQNEGSNQSLSVIFSSPFKGAIYHELKLMKPLLKSSLQWGLNFKQLDRQVVKVPHQKALFQNVPCNDNFSLWIRPLSARQQPLFKYKETTISTNECFVPYSVTEKPSLISHLVATICVPVILLIAAVSTAFFFCRRDHIKFCEWRSLVLNYQQPADSESPNNICAEEGNNADEVLVVPVFCPDNQHILGVVQTLGSMIQNVSDSKVQMLSNEKLSAFTEEWLHQTSPYEILVILTDDLYNYYYSDNRECNSEPTDCFPNSEVTYAHSSCHLVLNSLHKLSAKSRTFKQPHFISLFSKAKPDLLDEFCASSGSKNAGSLILADIFENVCTKEVDFQVREKDFKSLLEDLKTESEKVSDKNIRLMENMKDLKKNLLKYYKSVQRNLTVEEVRGVPDFKSNGNIGERNGNTKVPSESVIFKNSRENSSVDFISSKNYSCCKGNCDKSQLKDKSDLQQNSGCIQNNNGYHQSNRVHRQQNNGHIQQNNGLNRRETSHFHIGYNNKNNLYDRKKIQQYQMDANDRHGVYMDTEYVGQCQEAEKQPFVPSDFIPPLLDNDSIDSLSINPNMLEVEILEVNQRNLPDNAW